MVKRFIGLFFILALTASTFSGATFRNIGMNEKICPMKCCKQWAKANKTRTSNGRYLCRVLMCSFDVPISTRNTAGSNLAPIFVAFDTTTGFERLFAARTIEVREHSVVENHPFRPLRPKYITNLAFLI